MSNPRVNSSQDWPGKQLGLAEPGAIGGVASYFRRLIAIIIDWSASILLSIAFFSYEAFTVLIIFAITRWLLTLLAGASFGQWIMGIALIRIDGNRASWWQSLIRTALLCLVLPIIFIDSDQRGAHDRVAGTVLVRVR